MLLRNATIPGKSSHSSHFLNQESRAIARRQGSAAKSTRLFGRRVKRSPMFGSGCRRCCRPCAYPCQLAKTQSISGVMEHLKASSSKWLKTQGIRSFSWQRGYGAFSVSQSHVVSVISYIEKQEEHHRTITFEEEFRLFLNHYRVAFDERYVWD